MSIVTTVVGHDGRPGWPSMPAVGNNTKRDPDGPGREAPVGGSAQIAVESDGRVPAALPVWRLKRVVRYVESRLDEKIRLADLAREVRLSRMHFAAQFRAATGLKPSEYVMRRRIEKAQELLSTSDQSIVQIALAVGFETQAHFTSVFGRLVGETPRRWRLAMAERDSCINTQAECSCGRVPVVGYSYDVADDDSNSNGFGLRGAERTTVLEQSASSASHDLNNILARMIATMDLIAVRARSGSLVGLDALIEEGRLAGEQASDIAGRMIDYTRAPGRPLCAVDVNLLITRNQPLFCRALRNEGICRLNLQHDLLPAWCDSSGLERALLNLINDARDDLMGRSGTVTLETFNAALPNPRDGLAPGNYVCIAVCDDGCGMPEDALKRASGPFGTTKSRACAARLGLALVHRFIDQSDGHIDIESNPGVGTIIRMYLPTQSQLSGTAAYAARARPELRCAQR